MKFRTRRQREQELAREIQDLWRWGRSNHFTIVNALLLKPFPFKDSEQLVVLSTVFQRLGTDRGSVSYPDVADWKSQRDLFEAVSFFSQFNLDVTGGIQPERVRTLLVEDDTSAF